MTFSFNSVVFVGIYYGNVWEAKRFPFVRSFLPISVLGLGIHPSQLSQELFYANGTVYNQLLILNEKFEVDKTLLEQQGLVRSYVYPFHSLINTFVAILRRHMGVPTHHNKSRNRCYFWPSLNMEPR